MTVEISYAAVVSVAVRPPGAAAPGGPLPGAEEVLVGVQGSEGGVRQLAAQQSQRLGAGLAGGELPCRGKPCRGGCRGPGDRDRGPAGASCRQQMWSIRRPYVTAWASTAASNAASFASRPPGEAPRGTRL
jgi:hypothetical protein